MKVLSLIPARMASSRFPGKPLVDIHGFPMLSYIANASQSSELVMDTFIATCDQSIVDFADQFGFKSVMTSKAHERASDRCAEALTNIESELGLQYDIILMLQGDEPMITTDMINASLIPFLNSPSINTVNMMSVINQERELYSQNTIKVVADSHNNALYFSRSPIPSNTRNSNVTYYKQVCIIPFRRESLLDYLSLPPSPLEQFESVDMLRLLEYGRKVHMVLTDVQTYAVDTPEDLDLVRSLMAK